MYVCMYIYIYLFICMHIYIYRARFKKRKVICNFCDIAIQFSKVIRNCESYK